MLNFFKIFADNEFVVNKKLLDITFFVAIFLSNKTFETTVSWCFPKTNIYFHFKTLLLSRKLIFLFNFQDFVVLKILIYL